MKLRQVIAAAVFASLVACTSITPVEKQYSGFLGDYSQMEKVKTADASHAMRWVNPDVKKGAYKKIIVPPVTYFPAPSPSEQVDLATLNQISSHLTERMRAELGKNFEITDVPGPNTLHFQIAITGVSTPAEGMKAYEVIPVAMIFAGASSAMGTRDRVTVVYVEGLATDSKSGTTMVKGVRQGVGEDLKDEKQQLDLEKVKSLLDGWAIEMSVLAKKLL